MATSLELAITAIRSGRKEEGRQLLNLLIQQNPNNEMAWLWMSSVVNTDEQRARCLYHVLAINPKNELARRGLQLLGIVVSDSRPVRIPRDSQPIPIQKPQPEVSLSDSLLNPTTLPAQSPQPPTQPIPLPPVAPVLPGQSAPDVERRPFRLDPRTITQELPFIPLREPFAETARRSPSAFTTPPTTPDAPAGQPPIGGPGPIPSVSPVAQPGQTGSLPQPAAPISAVPGAAAGQGNAVGSPGPSESVPVTPNDNSASPAAGLAQPEQAEPKAVTDTGPLSNLALSGEQNDALLPGQAPPVPTASPQMPANGGTTSHQETRPSPPIWTTQTNAATGMPQPAPANPAVFPPAPSLNSNVTMGMPTPYLQPQPPPQVLPGFHSNATMGMPLPMPNGQPFPAEAMAMLHSNATMSMPTYSPVYPTPFPQSPVYHSSPTMSMPTMTEAEARARLLAGQGIAPSLDPIAALRAAAVSAELNAHRSRSAKRGAGDDEDEEEEDVNLLAVIVFGSLSVTALGGLGMLILLWFTSV